jgi:hypothetical protein
MICWYVIFHAVVNVTHPDHLVASSKVRDLHELVAAERKADFPKWRAPDACCRTVRRPSRALPAVVLFQGYGVRLLLVWCW